MKIADRAAAIAKVLTEQRSHRDQAAADLTDLESQRRDALRDGQVETAQALSADIARLRAEIAALDPEVAELEAVEVEIANERHLAEAQEHLDAAQRQTDQLRSALDERADAISEALLELADLLRGGFAMESAIAAALDDVRQHSRDVHVRSGGDVNDARFVSVPGGGYRPVSRLADERHLHDIVRLGH